MTDESVPQSSLILYQTEDGRTRIQCRFENETLWLTQAQMAELFETTPQNITLHLRSIFEDGELSEAATCKEYLQVRKEGAREVSRELRHYRLEAILAVGFRVRSHRGTQFRQWATARLSEFLVKGFTMDDERLKNPPVAEQQDYFDELLERIREIRASEKRFYQKIRDLYALSIDYDPSTNETKEFFQIVQNKLHWAITGNTVAEIIADRASAEKPNMGLTTWKGAKVRKADVMVAKNYLNDDEIRQLNRIVTMYLDYAEEQAERRKPLHMRDWREKLDGFLQFNERDVLKNAGRISAEIAKQLALDEYEKFERKRFTEEAAGPDELAALLVSSGPVAPTSPPPLDHPSTGGKATKSRRKAGAPPPFSPGRRGRGMRASNNPTKPSKGKRS